MLVPLARLKEYIRLDLAPEELAARLRQAGERSPDGRPLDAPPEGASGGQTADGPMEAAVVQGAGDWWDPETIVVGHVVAVHEHPNADRLVLLDVAYGAPEPEQIVTSAGNMFRYRGTPAEQVPVLKVAFARAGAYLLDAYSEERPRPRIKLKPSRIRGVPSRGMVCSERELGLSEEHEDIIVLLEDAPVGLPLRDYLGVDVLILRGPTTENWRTLQDVARGIAQLTGAPLA
jgi:phenylalanyl-tRNA synthetase beta chain